MTSTGQATTMLACLATIAAVSAVLFMVTVRGRVTRGGA
jgi:hypothetical protein